MSVLYPNINVLTSFPSEDKMSAEKKLDQAFSEFGHKIVVLDDDPTGTQTVHGVPVYTDWDTETLRQAFHDKGTMFFILTNSRSFSAEKTAILHRSIAVSLSVISREMNIPFLLISRGDSTLKGIIHLKRIF